MKKSAMDNIHNMNQRAINSYAEHQLNSLKSQFGTSQGSTNKKTQQNTSNKKASSLWDELNEGKSKQESGNFESSNVTYIKNPPIVNQQPVQPQNLQLEQALKQIQDLEQALIQARDVVLEKDNVIQNKNNQLLEVQERLLEKTEQVNVEHNKYVDTKHKLDTHKLKLTNFIDTHQDIDGQDQLVEMLGDLNIEE